MAENQGPGGERRKLVIAIDFGTTFSGVAWALSTDPDNVTYLNTWPKETGDPRVSGKVPTQLRRLGAGRSHWGFLVPDDAPSDDVFRFFKLKLDARPEIADVPRPAALQDFNDTEVDELIHEYLLALGNYLKQDLEERYGDDIITNSDVHYVITVPAIWTPRATQRTQRAFERALGPGLANPILNISEPEAAANCILQRADDQIIRPDDTFMVVDAGGGTVDLISYTLRRLLPLNVTEVVPGSGDFCGGATVTNRFEEWFRSKVGNEANFNEDIVRGAVKRFDETIKPSVTSATLANNQSFRIPVQGLSDNAEIGVDDEWLSLTAGEIVTLFQPSFERIKLLVAQQIATANVRITTIVMVGGFGQCQYLREELEAEELVREHNIRIIQPANAWTAVVEGAVMFGLSRVSPRPMNGATVNFQRKARRHYGTEMTVAYYDGSMASLVDKRYWDGLEGRWVVDLMSWFIKTGDDVDETRPFLKNFSLTCRVNFGKPETIYLIVYDCEADVAPLARDDSVRDLCTVEADLRQIPESQIEQRRGTDGFMYYYLDGNIEAAYGGTSVAYTLIYNGHRYNTVTAEFAS